MICDHTDHAFDGTMAEATHVSCSSWARYCARHACPRCKPLHAPPAAAPVSAATELCDPKYPCANGLRCAMHCGPPVDPPELAPRVTPDDLAVAEPMVQDAQYIAGRLRALRERLRLAQALGATTDVQVGPDPRDAKIAELEAENARLRTELAAAAEKASQFVVGGRATEAWLAEVTAERDRLREALGRVLQDLCDLLNRNDVIATVRAALKGTET